MKFLLRKIGLWLLTKEWFQTEVMKYMTSLLENDLEKDHKLVQFIKRHKRSILAITRKESANDYTQIDERFVNALKKGMGS